MNIKISSELNLKTIVLASAIALSVTVLFGMAMIYNNSLFGYHYPLQIAAGAQGTNASKTTTTASTTTTSNGAATIQLTAKEVSNGVYRWIDTTNGAANPKLKVFENANNIIKIQNPTDTKHQLIIDTGADELPARLLSSPFLVQSSGVWLQLYYNATTVRTYNWQT